MRIILMISLWVGLQIPMFAGINFFEGSYEEALALAKEERKIIFIDAYASWCGPCKVMAKNVFTQQEVGDYYNSNFINLKLDMEKKEATAFKRSFSVSAYPTLFFIDGEENLVHKIVGGQNGAGLIGAGELTMSKFDVSTDYAADYEAGERDPAFILEYVKALNASNKNSLPISNKYLITQKDLSTDFNMSFIYEANVACDSRIFSLFEKYKNQLIAKYGKDAVQKKIKSACVNTMKKALEYGSQDLLEEAHEKYARHAPKKEALRFELESSIRFEHDRDAYEKMLSLIKKLNKSCLKEDAKAKIKWSRELDVYAHDFRDFEDYALKLAEEAVELEESLSNWQHYYDLLVTYNEYSANSNYTKRIQEVELILDALNQ
jgi:thiol-disulfide isomerase/thioredoxin